MSTLKDKMTEDKPNYRTIAISQIEKAFADNATNVVMKDSSDKEFIYDLAKYFKIQDKKYFVRVGPHDDQYTLIVERLPQ